MTGPESASAPMPGVVARTPLGEWVTTPDGRIGQVWAEHAKAGRWWVAFGTPATAGDHFTLDELDVVEGPRFEQELPL